MIKCRHFGECGGCRFQDITYAEQLINKQKEIEALFDYPVSPVIPCDPPWRYRNKMEYTFSMDKKGERYLGLFKRDGRGRVLNLEECWLVSPWFQEGLEAVRKWWGERGLLAFHPYKNTGSLRTLTLREGIRTGDRMAFLTVSGVPEWALKKEDLTSFVEAMQQAVGQKPLSLFIRIQQAIKGQPTEFFEMHLAGPDHYREELFIERPLTFHISPSAFFQPNPVQAEKLFQIAASLVKTSQEEVIWDLYCGTGTFGIALAARAKQVIGLELSPESSLDARENVKRNGLKNVEIITGDVGELLQKGHYPKPDIILLDPPRSGLDKKAMAQLLAAHPRQIIYISCNPKTQAENCKEFIQAGYKITTMQPVDQFPHTAHIENIVCLEV